MPSKRSSSALLRTLPKRAREALARGDLAAAVELYTQLEQCDHDSPEWPRQLASLHQRAGRTEDELAALVRCADRHAARGEFLPALATYKMVLSTDPGHVAAQQHLAALQPESSVSVEYGGDEAPSPVAPARVPLRVRRERPSPSTTSAPLDELVLTDIVEGAHPAHLADVTLDGIHEIPLEDELARSARPKPGRSAPATASETPAARARVEQLGRSPLFGSLDRNSLARLVEKVKLVELRAGEELFHQGDPAGALYVVAQGAVVPIAEGETRTRLAVLESGEFFGEIALFTNQPRNATVEALVDTQLLSIDRGVMWSLVQDHPDLLSLLLRFLRERLIHRLVRTSPLFQIFPASKRSAIVRRFRFLEVSDGHAVIDQHRPADAVFILLSGHMDVVHRDDTGAGEDGAEKVLATLAPGELFGEMSLLWREPSLASVVARGKCWLLALPAASFQEMLDHHPELAEVAAQIAEERRHQNRNTLRDALGHRDGKAGII